MNNGNIKHRTWTDTQVQFLHDNHSSMHPQQMANKLNETAIRVRTKMKSERLKTKKVIDSKAEDTEVSKLFGMGWNKYQIELKTGLGMARINKILMVKKINENYEATKKVTEHPKTDEAQNLLELKRLEAERIIPEHEGEQYTYNDLSPSEQLIYHYIKSDYLIDFKATVQQFRLTA